MERSGVEVSICGNDAWKVLANLLRAKKAARTFEKNRSGGNEGGRLHEQKCVRVRTLFKRFLSITNLFQDKKRVRFRVCVLYKRKLNLCTHVDSYYHLKQKLCEITF